MLFFLDKGYNHLVVTHLIPCQAVNYAIAFLGHRKNLTTTKGVHIYGNYWLEVKCCLVWINSNQILWIVVSAQSNQ
jgi:hypothetical protein